LLLLLIVPGKL